MKSAFDRFRGRLEIVFETERAFVQRDGDLLQLVQQGPWTDEMTRVMKRFKINALDLSERYKEEWPNLDFLRGLPLMRRLHVILSRPADLSPIASLGQLESLGIMGTVEREDRPVPAADFTPLEKLRQAYIELAPGTMSILHCASLQDLWLWNNRHPWLKSIDLSRLTNLRELHVTAWAKLTTLDLSHQPDLEFLHVEAIGKLKNVEFHPKARVRSLKAGGCGPFRIDWDRLGEDLHELALSGPVPFPLEELVQIAPNLRVLNTNGIRTFPPLKFLLKLPDLEEFTYFTTPPGPKFSEDDWEIYRTINSRGRGRE